MLTSLSLSLSLSPSLSLSTFLIEYVVHTMFPIIVCPTRMPFQSNERQINVFFLFSNPSGCSLRLLLGWRVILFFRIFRIFIFFPIWTDLLAMKQFLGSATFAHCRMRGPSLLSAPVSGRNFCLSTSLHFATDQLV